VDVVSTGGLARVRLSMMFASKLKLPITEIR
jgi:hypothetical protein